MSSSPGCRTRVAAGWLAVAAAFLLPFSGWGQAPPVPPPPGDSLALAAALRDMEAVRDAGGWPTIPPGATLREGDSGPRVAALRARLEGSADLPAGGPESLDPEAEAFDAALDRAVRRFQARHALDVDGVVGPATLAALNRPVEDRMRQVAINLEWRREYRPEDGPVKVLVNIPAFQALIVEEGREPELRRAIVGRPDRPTPLLAGRIEHVVVAPYWNVPPGILRADLLPQLRLDPSLLDRRAMSVMDRSTERAVDPASIDWAAITAAEFTRRYWIRQAPGPGNALGQVKFIFPNVHNVFLHDTPDQALFDRGRRAFSSGCVRVEGAMGMAERLVEAIAGWDGPRLQRAVETGIETWIRLPRPVPVQTVYWTAWVGAEGALHLADDLYGLDALRSEPVVVAGMSECAPA